MSPTPASRTLARFARWALIGAIVLMGAALVATVWSTVRRVEEASDTLVRGQSSVYFSALFGTVRGRRGAVDDSELAALIEQHRADGLRYLALVDRDGTVRAQAGEPAGDSLASALARLGENDQEWVGDRVRAVRGNRESRRGRPVLLVELEPKMAAELRGDARQALQVGAVVAGILLLVSAGLVRWFLRREELERQLAHERRLASLGEMSAVLAHEIRNPIASLKGNAQLLVKMLPADDRPRGKASRLVEETVRLETLTNDLLEFVRAGELAIEEVDPAELVREVAGAHPGRVEVDTAAAPDRWPLDRDRIRQVLGNLVDNACQASEAPVEISAAIDRDALELAVRDRGDGIPEADLDQIFEPFFTRKTRGTGLGLAVARRIVELHGGTLIAENAPDGGARFRARIPRS